MNRENLVKIIKINKFGTNSWNSNRDRQIKMIKEMRRKFIRIYKAVFDNKSNENHKIGREKSWKNEKTFIKLIEAELPMVKLG